VLLSRLLSWTRRALSLSNVSTYGWTDSTITLAWLKQHLSKWNMYVANRASEVQTSSADVTWQHVPSKENSADCAVGYRHRCYPPTTYGGTALLGWRAPPSRGQDAISRCQTNKLVRLVRVRAYVLRFIKNSQREKNSQPRKRLPIEVSELREATHRWFRLVQKVHFSKEWNALSKNEPIPNSSALKALKPMLGEDSLLRLGRRLQNAALEYGEKYFIILPKHRISELLIDCALLCMKVMEINANRLSQWQLVQAIQKQIWRSWSKDACTHCKLGIWLTSHSNIKINDLVIVRNPQLPPFRWELARVVNVHPGSDGHVRVMALCTARSQYKWPITQICKLPVLSEKDALENNSP
jgi:hypothetical protein